MLLIHTPRPAPREDYAFQILFRYVLGIEYSLSHNREQFLQYSGPKLSYGPEPIGQELHFKADGLLAETGVHPVKVLPADPFAASFWMATRYEEYLPFSPDDHQRFPATESLAFKNKFLERPVVHECAFSISEQLMQKFPGIKFQDRSYSVFPTIDIDNAYAYLGKGIFRTAGGTIRAVLKGNLNDLITRFAVLTGNKPDPYDTYTYLEAVHQKTGLQPIWFFLLGDRSAFDKNVPFDHPIMSALVRRLAHKDAIGIHPSYASNMHPEKIGMEKARLEKLSGQPVLRSRQHFLKLRFPETYRNLLKAGIQEDHSMGYADATGFRAGLCIPFPWYDLGQEEITKLMIHPFAMMDGTLNQYNGMTKEQALERTGELAKVVKKAGGDFRFIWHNETSGGRHDWKGWNAMYEQIIRKVL